jgi:hypothetical protein
MGKGRAQSLEEEMGTSEELSSLSPIMILVASTQMTQGLMKKKSKKHDGTNF